MNKPTLSILIIILPLFIVLTPLSSAQVVTERILPEQGYLPEQTIIVEILIQGESGEYTITETPPLGWTVSNISHQGQSVDNKIQWTLMINATRPLTLSYWLLVPDDAAGTYEFSGIINDQPITESSHLRPHKLSPVGIFSDHCDSIGRGITLGNVNYDSLSGEYEMISRDQILFDWINDGGHMLYKQVWGDVTLIAKVHPTQLTPSNPKYASVGGLGFYDSFTQGSKYFKVNTWADCAYRPDPTVETVWRTKDNTKLNPDFIRHLPYTDHKYEIKVVRQNNDCFSYYRHTPNDEWTLHLTKTILFEDPIIVFLLPRALTETSSVLSEPMTWSRAIYSDVQIIERSVSIQDWALY